MKSIKISTVAAVLCMALHAAAPVSDITISGIVTDGSNPIDKAIVTLVNKSMLTDTTDAKGAFRISNSTDIRGGAGLNPVINSTVRLRGRTLCFLIPSAMSTISIRLYDGGGRCVLSRSVEKNAEGSPVMDLPELVPGLYLVVFAAGRDSLIRKLVVTATAIYLDGPGTIKAATADLRETGRNLAIVDQLRVSKTGFITRFVDLSSYKVENLSIVLKPVGSDTVPNERSLCKKYKNLFPIGAAIDGNSYKDAHAAIWKEHFNSMVCENEMKWSVLQPSEGNFQFSQANAMVNAARSNGMLVRGHAPVWFDQTPDWVFQGATKEKLLQRIRTHVTRVMQEFKGRVYAWDVVNEAVIGYDANDNDVGEDLGSLKRWGYRNSKWYQIAGEDHIFEAFRAARAADPDAKLFYNDFWNYLDGKREFIISFVKKLQQEKLIDGVGLQCHLNISPAKEKMSNQSVYQTIENLEKEIREYAALGLDVHITELDISIYTRDYTSDDQSRWYTGSSLNEEYQSKLAARYKELFDMLRRNAGKVQNVTFWGIADDNTWLSEFPSKRPDHPLLFDKQLKPKKAFDAVMDF